jgi:glycosyltransferase involved in cell wall biosynthesis
LYSIAQQQTTFHLEICIVDDASDIDPEPIIEKSLKGLDWSYMRLEKHVGFKHSQSYCLNLISDDTDAVILQSADVIHSSPYSIQTLCDSLDEKTIVLAEVRNLEVSPVLHASFEKNVRFYLTDDAVKNPEPGVQIYYSGTKQPDPDKRWYYFLGAILKNDLLSTSYKDNCFDVEFSKELHKLGFKAVQLDNVIGIHQRH